MKRYLKTCLFVGGIFLGSLSAVGLEFAHEQTSKKTLSQYMDNSRVQEVIKAAKEYQLALTEYMLWPEGKDEYVKKNSLREAYLNTNGTHEEILKKVASLGPELTWRINEWNRKVTLNIMHKCHAPELSVEEFYKQAQGYKKAFSAILDHPKTKNYMVSHFAFKEAVLNLVKEGVPPEEISKMLKEQGVDSRRVVAKVNYWYKKATPEEGELVS